MIPLQFISKLIKILRSAASPSQIAGGFILGMVLGLSPFFLSLISLVVILLIIILNVNLATAIFSFAIFSGVAYLADPLFHSLGYEFLVDFTALKGLWTWLYNAPIIPYTRFNNTVMLGSLIVALVLMIPVFLGVKRFIILYREKYEPKVQNWKWMKYLKSTQVYQLYERLKFLGD